MKLHSNKALIGSVMLMVINLWWSLKSSPLYLSLNAVLLLRGRCPFFLAVFAHGCVLTLSLWQLSTLNEYVPEVHCMLTTLYILEIMNGIFLLFCNSDPEGRVTRNSIMYDVFGILTIALDAFLWMLALAWYPESTNRMICWIYLSLFGVIIKLSMKHRKLEDYKRDQYLFLEEAIQQQKEWEVSNTESSDEENLSSASDNSEVLQRQELLYRVHQLRQLNKC